MYTRQVYTSAGGKKNKLLELASAPTPYRFRWVCRELSCLRRTRPHMKVKRIKNATAKPLQVIFAAIVLGLLVHAQQPTIPSTGFPGLDQYRASRIAVFTDDFGQLARYRDANASLPRPLRANRGWCFSETRLPIFGN